MELTHSLKKRATNMVWTAAGRYDFEPVYLFFHSNNEPSLYLNTLEGLAYRTMNPDILLPFLKGWTLDANRKNSVLWLSWFWNRQSSHGNAAGAPLFLLLGKSMPDCI